MKLKINKKKFVENFLNPASKLTENISIDFEENVIKTLVSSSDNSIVLIIKLDCELSNPTKIAIPDCKAFLRLVSNIDSNDMELTFESNSIIFSSNQFSFKYHLLDENYALSKKAFNEKKLNSIQFHTKFNLSKKSISEILRYNSIIPDAEKLYFFTEDQCVYCKLADKEKPNINEIKVCVSEAFEGLPIPEYSFLIDIQNLVLTSFASDEITAEINHELKICKLQSNGLMYIISGLVK